ncbi:MAG: NrtA/SsuA/CpmA family ABC transporter substrate-binding protein [Verrucomicrobia bacterium]|nr:NrtA/SsuA/CpmA family ABC transporter substrate-binding protein [Verrucomicrobiota bacterium]
MTTLRGETRARVVARWAAPCVFVALAVVTNFSCKPERTPEHAERARMPVALGIGMAPLAALAIIADAEGCFAREGAAVSVRRYASGKLALDAMLAGEVLAATAAVTPVVFSSFKRRDFSLVASIGSSNNDTRIVARKDRGITRAADLRGKRVATQEASAVHFFLHMFLLKQGMTEKDVTIHNLTPADFPQALARGDVDACSLREPLISQALALLGDNAVVFEQPELHVEYHNLLLCNPFLEKRPETVRRLLRAFLAAETFARRHPQRAKTTVARALAISEPALNRFWPWLDLRVRLSQSLLLAMEDQARWAMSRQEAEGAAMPNYLQFVRLDAMLSVKPSAVSIIR